MLLFNYPLGLVQGLWVKTHSKERSTLCYNWIACHFLYNRFFEWNLMQLVKKNGSSFPNKWIFFLNHCWRNRNLSKFANSLKILCFVLKKDDNFKSYQNMSIVTMINFMYHKLKLCSIHHVHYTIYIYIYVIKQSWKVEILKHTWVKT